jgi:hypothetical protein
MDISAKEIAQALGRGKESKLNDGGWKTICPAHDDKAASLTVRDTHGKILVRCHAGCIQDNVIRCLQDLDLWPKTERKASWTPVHPVPEGVALPPKDRKHNRLGLPVRRWAYLNGFGELLGYIYRFEDSTGKTLLPLSYCKSDDDKFEWQWKSFEKPRPLYGLDKLASHPERKVAVFEGEKAADAATKIFPNYVCISWPGGSKAIKYVDITPLYNRDVSLWPDNDKPGYEAMNSLAEMLLADNSQKCKMVLVPTDLPKGWDVADELPEKPKLDLKQMLETAKMYEPASDSVMAQLNKRYAFVLIGGKGSILRETVNQRKNLIDINYLTPEGFNQFYINQRIQVGRTEIPIGKYWFTHEERRTYEGITFAPGQDAPGYYNLWRGFNVEPDPTGDWSIFREHLLANAASGNESHFNWIFGWFAQMYQKPWRKVGTSLSFRGKQGTGKTIIGLIFGHLIKQHYTLVDDTRYVFGNFNSHMASTLLLHSDEGFWGGDPKHVGKLRSMVTSEQHFVEYKGRDPIPVDNYMRLLITTNQDWVAPAAAEERRFAVFDMGDEREQDRKYFVEMLRQMRDGGYSGLLYDLLHFDLSSVDIGQIPETQALQDQKEISLSDVGKFWFNCLMAGETLIDQSLGWQEETPMGRFYELFVEQLNDWGVRYKPTQHEFLKLLKAFAPEGSFEMVRKVSSSKRYWNCVMPPLEQARKFFDELHKTKFNWLEDKNSEPSKPVKEVDEEIPF